ncbi:MAG: hypothetical protein R3C05_29260 [Pirellulaceae bacterium]
MLGDLHLAPPPSGPRPTGRRVAPASEITRAAGDSIPLPCPLFAYDLPWHLLTPTQGARLAHDLAEAQVFTSVLSQDIEGVPPTAHHMCPYRPERYGVTLDDLAAASIVDLRLTSEVGDGSVYTIEQLRRWDKRADSLPDSTVITGSRWPPDVAAPDRLRRKIDQLRVLAPQAAVFVAISPFHLQSDLANVLVAKPDGVILRFDLDPTSLSTGYLIAMQTAACRTMIDQSDAANTTMWVAAPTMTALDLVKLLALGAAAVSIDYLVLHHWHEVIDTHSSDQHAAEYSFSQTAAATDETTVARKNPIAPVVEDLLGEALTFVHGLGAAHYSQLRREMLATVDENLAAKTGALLIR